MSGFTGAARIVRFNWPWYASALAVALVAAWAMARHLGGMWALLGGAALSAGLFWSLASLAVSHWVYDRSPLADGSWLPRAVGVGGADGAADAAGAEERRVAIFHAGLDDASEAVARRLPGARTRVFDFHGMRAGTPSLERARAEAVSAGEAVAPGRIPLADGSVDLALLVFAAHELRREGERLALFREIARSLAPGGRLILVEHLRDAWNLLAFGPGAFHFLPRGAWRRAFAAGSLEVLRESGCTPFVRVFALGKGR